MLRKLFLDHRFTSMAIITAESNLNSESDENSSPSSPIILVDDGNTTGQRSPSPITIAASSFPSNSRKRSQISSPSSSLSLPSQNKAISNLPSSLIAPSVHSSLISSTTGKVFPKASSISPPQTFSLKQSNSISKNIGAASPSSFAASSQALSFSIANILSKRESDKQKDLVKKHEPGKRTETCIGIA